MKTVVVIPAYNEEKVIQGVLDEVKQLIAPENIIVIDDGSYDNTAQIVKNNGITVYSHIINRGLGGALGTGLKAGLLHDADAVITLDADGQHKPEELKNLLEPLEKDQADVVIGSRFLTSQKMPKMRRLFNFVGNMITWVLFGIWTTDSQSGYRAFNRRAARLIEIKTNKMEVSSEFFKEIKGNNLRLKEVPITAIYTEYSMSKGQSFTEGLKTVVRLILLRFRK